MDRSVEVLMGIVAAVIAGVITYVVYRWLEWRRVQRIEGWVKEYLSDRYGELPASLRIACSDDRLWPVLVDFIGPRTGVLHRLQFTCDGTHSSFTLLSDKEEAG